MTSSPFEFGFQVTGAELHDHVGEFLPDRALEHLDSVLAAELFHRLYFTFESL